MTLRKRIPVAVLLSGSLVLAGCSDDGESGDPLETLDIMAPYFSATPPEEDDPIDEALSEIAGVDLSVQWVPNSDYGAKTNTVLAGDDIPDVMVIQGKDQAFVQTAEAGGFWDLTDYLASGDYPNLVTENPEVQEASSVNGKVYGVYRARDVIRHSVIIRQDWLENLGLELPETTDDLMEIARAFTEDDPDGNGEDDTYGMINIAWSGLGNGSPYDAIEVWHGAGNLWRDEGGELVPSFTTDEWKQALGYERELIQNGYVNPDYATLDGAKWNEPFLNGEGGIIIDVQSRAAQLVDLFKEQDPENYDQYVALAGQLDGPNGTYAMPTAGYSGFLAIPRSGVQTEEQLKEVLTVLDKLNTKDAQVLMNNGIEGDNFTVEDGYSVDNPDRQDFTDQVTGAWAQLGMNVAGYEAYKAKPESEYDEQIAQLRLELQAEDLENAVFNPAASLVSPTYTTNGAQLDTIITDARIQYIAGQIDDAGLQDAIDQWYASGGEDVITEINDLYAELD
ncbi:extracellular solute-binding protein [Glycomyces arizonensis]|uniref:extracellular solute-binding protein n=1 Tax=Glycomyces arizonensis TaxID=256035 RepID=UPI000413A792|nr:extracellular solute-binding protein [Glycomyces arizonensis]